MSWRPLAASRSGSISRNQATGSGSDLDGNSRHVVALGTTPAEGDDRLENRIDDFLGGSLPALVDHLAQPFRSELHPLRVRCLENPVGAEYEYVPDPQRKGHLVIADTGERSQGNTGQFNLAATLSGTTHRIR